ncbi:MAG TPA: YihY/virulence factor BrkB family protein [Tepidisphaeraceae bacterium]|nr:YihY/virulence factor BrkB family protein [Tepidisphaeraceae bacterium]
MARLREVSRVLKSVGVFAFSRRVWEEVAKDNLFVWASALAYSWLFAIFPFLLFLLALIPYLPQATKERAQVRLPEMVGHVMPTAASKTVWDNVPKAVDSLAHQRRGPLMYLGLVVALWAASGGTAMTMSALDRCYELEKGRPLYLQRPLAILLTVIIAIMLLTVIGLLPVMTLFRDWILGPGNTTRWSWQMILFDLSRWSASLVLMLMILMVIYHKGPAVRQHFSPITPGAVFVVVVWVVLGLLFRLYVDRIGAKGYSRTYGTVGGVAILLLFFYIDALVLLIGAEINSEIDFEVLKVRRGTRDFRRPEDFSNGAPTDC